MDFESLLHCEAPELIITCIDCVHFRSAVNSPNPAFLEAEHRDFSTWNIPKEIRGYRLEEERLIAPRGFGRQLVGILQGAGVRFEIEDKRRTLPEVDFTFHGHLHDFQEKAVSTMGDRNFGTLSAPTGTGKVVVALINVNQGVEIPPKPDFYS